MNNNNIPYLIPLKICKTSKESSFEKPLQSANLENA